MADSTEFLKRHAKVVAAEKLPDVPRGTPGKVILVNGITWIRYRVLFDNAVDLGSLNREQLYTRDEWAEVERAEAKEAAAAARAAD